jgi:23S rRNA (adenine2503-C2)-methyltransferase
VPISILACTQQEFVQEVYDQLGKGKRHAALLYKQWAREGKIEPKSWAEPQAEKLVQEIWSLVCTEIPSVAVEQREGEIVKFLLRLSDGLQVETVIIPMQSGVTLCLSSQVGCKRGCAFCETGRQGLVRSLSVEEIVAQVFVAKFLFLAPVRNLVFMGMGEPFDNYDNVMKAVKILTEGWGFGPSRLTVSTSGCVEGIYRFMREADPAVNLALSLHAVTDELRNRLMPVNRVWNLQELRKALEEYCLHPRREIFIEYILLKGINDGVEQADALAQFLEGLRVKVNLIPYNAQRRSRYEASDEEAQEIFLERLRKKGYRVFLRQSKGRKIQAACGQLSTKSIMGQNKRVYGQ